MEIYSPTDRTHVRRLPQRAVYDKAQVSAILDEGYVCHIGFVVDGQPYVIPTLYARAGQRIEDVEGQRRRAEQEMGEETYAGGRVRTGPLQNRRGSAAAIAR